MRFGGRVSRGGAWSMFPRLVAGVVALAMAVTYGVAPAVAEETSSSGDSDSLSLDVWFYDSAGWASPFFYWYTDGAQPVAWPGVAMEDAGGGWYTYEVEGCDSVKGIFSDNGASQSPGAGEPGLDLSGGDSGAVWVVDGQLYDAQPEGVTVHYYDWDSWGNVDLYWYDSSGAAGPAWPGAVMFPEGDGWWSRTVFGMGDGLKVLFNDGGPRQVPARLEDGFPVSGEMWYRNGEWTDERPEDVRVVWRNPDGWGSPSVYYYASDSDTGPAWPGTAMTQLSEGWWGLAITRYSSARAVFTDGASQAPARLEPGFTVAGVSWCDVSGCVQVAGGSAGADGGSGFTRGGARHVVEMILTGGDPGLDSDGDGLSDVVEFLCSDTDPSTADVDAGTDLDPDGDGLDAAAECAADTDAWNADTDGDGLSDGDEVNVWRTDPLTADTDGDGVDDGREAAWGSDPLTAETTFQARAEAVGGDGVTASVEASLPAAQAQALDVRGLQDDVRFPAGMPGRVSSAFGFTTRGDISEATVSFTFDPSLLEDPSFDPVVYWWDEDTGVLAEQPTTVSGSTASAAVSHFSTYILLDRRVFADSFSWVDTWSTESYGAERVVLVIDDSGSMMYNDSSGQRLQVARDLINGLPDGVEAGVVRFAGGATVLSALTGDKTTLLAALDDSNFHSTGGTMMYSGIQAGLSLFDGAAADEGRTLVALTDGESSDTSLHDATVASANSLGVKVTTVGLGSDTAAFDTWLRPLASQTGGSFHTVDDADGLAGIYERIGQRIDMETDSDGDGIADWYEENMVLFNGVTLALDPDNPDTDGDGIPDGEEIGGLSYTYNEDRSKVVVTGRLVSDPTVEDTDGDGLPDLDEEDWGTSPTDPDTDGDGLTDGEEEMLWYDPLDADPDNDGDNDYEELLKDQDPYVYDNEWYETGALFGTGALAGDWGDGMWGSDTVPFVLGQVAGSFIPGYADIRDTLKSLKDKDLGSLLLNVAGMIPVGGDAAKAADVLVKAVDRFGKASRGVARMTHLVRLLDTKAARLIPVLQNTTVAASMTGAFLAATDPAMTYQAMQSFLDIFDPREDASGTTQAKAKAPRRAKTNGVKKVSLRLSKRFAEDPRIAGKGHFNIDNARSYFVDDPAAEALKRGDDELVDDGRLVKVSTDPDESDLWGKITASRRGYKIDDTVNGANDTRHLRGNYPRIDDFYCRPKGGCDFISTKSLNLGAGSYASDSAVKARLRKYMRDLNGYSSSCWPNGRSGSLRKTCELKENLKIKKRGADGTIITKTYTGKDLTEEFDDESNRRILEIVLPDEIITDSRLDMFAEFADEAEKNGVTVWYKTAEGVVL